MYTVVSPSIVCAEVPELLIERANLSESLKGEHRPEQLCMQIVYEETDFTFLE